MKKYIHLDENESITLGQVGDIITRIVVVPSSTVVTGVLSIKDGSDPIMKIYDADSTVLPVSIELGIQSELGGWTITTGAGISAIIIGEWN